MCVCVLQPTFSQPTFFLLILHDEKKTKTIIKRQRAFLSRKDGMVGASEKRVLEEGGRVDGLPYLVWFFCLAGCRCRQPAFFVEKGLIRGEFLKL